MLEVLTGKIASYKAVTKRTVQLEFAAVNKIIELTVADAWVINRNDEVTVVGEVDAKTGKFIAYAYRNHSKGIHGKFLASRSAGWVFVIAGILFFWAIFPLLVHLPLGLKQIALSKKVDQAFDMLPTNA